MKVEFRPASIADVMSYAGRLPHTQCRVWAGLVDGKVVALGGYTYLPSGVVVAFLDADEIVRQKCKLSLLKAAKTVLRDAKSRGLSVIHAEAGSGIEAAVPFLKHLGFTETGGVYIHGN